MHVDCELARMSSSWTESQLGFVSLGGLLDFTTMFNLNKELIKSAGDKWKSPHWARRKSSFHIKK